jgi:hypothetical protein
MIVLNAVPRRLCYLGLDFGEDIIESLPPSYEGVVNS